MLYAAGVTGALAAYRVDARALYALGKATASAGFLAAALAGGVPEAGWSRLALVALGAAALGDVALAGRGRASFVVGMAAFTAAHATYAAAFAVRTSAPGVALAAAALGLLAGMAGWRYFGARLEVPGRLHGPVAAYAAVVGAMVGLALAAGAIQGVWTLPVGAALVGGSDVAVARQRFGRSGFANKLVGLPTYYAGQLLIALQVAAG